MPQLRPYTIRIVTEHGIEHTYNEWAHSFDGADLLAVTAHNEVTNGEPIRYLATSISQHHLTSTIN